jgi:hypothetical protein
MTQKGGILSDKRKARSTFSRQPLQKAIQLCKPLIAGSTALPYNSLPSLQRLTPHLLPAQSAAHGEYTTPAPTFTLTKGNFNFVT